MIGRIFRKIVCRCPFFSFVHIREYFMQPLNQLKLRISVALMMGLDNKFKIYIKYQ